MSEYMYATLSPLPPQTNTNTTNNTSQLHERRQSKASDTLPTPVKSRSRSWLRRHYRASSEDRRASSSTTASATPKAYYPTNASVHSFGIWNTEATSAADDAAATPRSSFASKRSRIFHPSISKKRPAPTGLNPKHVAMGPDSDAHKPSGNFTTKQVKPASFASRTESLSSTSVNTAVSHRTVTSTDHSDNHASQRLIQRNGRTYINEPSLPYDLPIDLTELHRQSLRTLLLIQVHGAPLICPQLKAKPPRRVLEIGCGPGFWSMMCHRYFKSKGHSGIQFVGIDIAQLDTPSDATKPDKDMNWTFVQHDVRQQPWPFEEGEFDLVFNKDMTLAIDAPTHPGFTEESIRVLAPGGILEIWETDHMIRMLRPHVPTANPPEEQEAAFSLGAYIINLNTPLSAPLNTFLVEYNSWLQRALEARGLLPNPCTVVNHYLLQESETLKTLGSHRVAIPLSEVRWEREGVGGVITKDGKSYVEMKGELRPKVERKTLSAGQAALRRTALLTLVEEIQALEPMLREASGKSQDEWDVWLGKMMTDLMSEGGASWGECLETGAWWARKKNAGDLP